MRNVSSSDTAHVAIDTSIKTINVISPWWFDLFNSKLQFLQEGSSMYYGI